MTQHILKFFLIFIFIFLFLSFKNQTKILENDLIKLKIDYRKDIQNYINKEILLTKQISQLQINQSNKYELVENKKLLNLIEMNLMTLQL